MKTLSVLLTGLVLSLCANLNAQSTKDFTLHSPSDQGTVVLQGDKTTILPFKWTSGKGPQSVSVNYSYSLFFHVVGGDLETPLDNVSKDCCFSSFSDTVLNFTGEQWAGFLNGISQQVRGRDMKIGDTLDLIWRVNLTAVSPGPNYAYKQSTNDYTVRFIRGNFSDEYVPVKAKNPSNFYNLFVQDSPNQEIAFSWSSAYCPDGCEAASYELVIDTVDGDFSVPYYNVAVPNNDSSWKVNFAFFNQLLKDTRTAEGASRTIYWTVLAYGNGQVDYAPRRQITVWNGLLDNENRPYNLTSPANGLFLTLSGAGSTQLNFKWGSTYTSEGLVDAYSLVFDTLGGAPLFGSPLMEFPSGKDGKDTAVNLTYGQIDRGLDSLYPGWKTVHLMWSVKALVKGNYYYPAEHFSLQLNAGKITSLNPSESISTQLFPNPTRDVLFLDDAEEAREVNIYSLQGQLMLSQQLRAGENRISCSDLASGIYVVLVKQGDTLSSNKVVISR